jgi:hypothetical protein
MSSTAKASIIIGGSSKELDAVVDRAVGKLTGMAATVAGLFAGAATFSWGYDLLKQGEAAEIGFTQMLGSADIAKQTLKELGDYASKTPFDNPTLVKAYRNLLNFKFAAQDIPGILRVLGDTAAAMPDGMTEGMNKLTIIMGQMRSKAKVSAGEMLQLTEAGINAWSYLQKELGLSSVAEAVAKVESGAVDSATGVRAVLKGMESDFGGVGEKMSKTVEGLMSTITDNAGRGLQAVFKGATGGDFKTWLNDLGEGLNGLGTTGEAIGQKIAAGFQVVKNIFDGIYAVGSGIGEVISAAFDAAGVKDFAGEMSNVRTNFDLVKNIAISFIKGFAIGLAFIGDAINNYVVGPIKVIGGLMVQFVSRILEATAALLDGLGYVSDTAQQMANDLHGVASRVNQFGEQLQAGGAKDINSGFDATAATKGFFDKVESNSGRMSMKDFQSGLMKSFTSSVGYTSGRLLDFGKKVGDMGSIAASASVGITQYQLELSKAAADAAKKYQDDAKSPVQKFKEEMKQLSELFNSRMIDRNVFADAAGKAVRGLGAGQQQYTPNNAILAGSAEAQSIITANRQGGSNRVEDIMKSVEREAAMTRKLNEGILKELQKTKLVSVGI